MRGDYISFDYAIKYILKSKSDYTILEGFLSAVLSVIGYSDIKVISLLDCESNKEEALQKRALADIVIEDENHVQYIVEIDRNARNEFVQKACFNASRAIVDSVQVGDSYLNINRVIHISLLYFDDKANTNSPISFGKVHFHDGHTNEKIQFKTSDKNGMTCDASDVFPKFIFISLPRFNGDTTTALGEWLYFLKDADIPQGCKAKGIVEAKRRLDSSLLKGEELAQYNEYIKRKIDENACLATATEKGLQEGLEKGKELGLQEGLEKGEEIGLQKGKAMEKRNLVVAMLNSGESIEKIILYTGLSESEIDRIRYSLQ